MSCTKQLIEQLTLMIAYKKDRWSERVSDRIIEESKLHNT